MKRFIKNKKVLFGLATSLVLALAIGSFAMGETPATPRASEPQRAAGEPTSVDVGAFTITGESVTEGTDYTFSGTSGTNGVLTIISTKEMTIKNKNSDTPTTDRIVIGDDTHLKQGDTVNLTLAGVNINTCLYTGMINAAFNIAYNAEFNVNITLADNSKNYLTSYSNCAGLSKGDDKTTKDDIDKLGTLTIGVPTDSTAKNGMLEAIGGDCGAGIGGGYQGNGRKIKISGGVVTATGGDVGPYSNGGDGIGGGCYGGGSSNTISGNAVVMATSGKSGTAALQGFDGASGGSIDKGVTFTGYGSNFDGDGRATDFVWDVSGNAYGYVEISENETFPASLTITTGSKLTVGSEANITLASGANITVADGAELVNDGTIPDDGTVVCDGTGTGKVTTKTDFYREGETTVYKTGYQTYQTRAGVQKYKDLPNPDDTTLLENSLNSDKFLYWYYLDKDGKEVAIKDGDAGDNVLPNQHKFYEKREEAYTISTSKEGEGSITPNATEAYEGDEVTFTVTPADGYELKEGSVSVKAGDKDVEFTEEDGKYTFTMPDSAVTISAVFEQSPEPTPTPPGPEPTPTPPGPEPGPTPEPTPDPSVDPDGDGSGASSKTSDPFMGGIALALLGVATTGAILTRKFK